MKNMAEDEQKLARTTRDVFQEANAEWSAMPDHVRAQLDRNRELRRFEESR